MIEFRFKYYSKDGSYIYDNSFWPSVKDAFANALYNVRVSSVVKIDLYRVSDNKLIATVYE